MSATVALIEYGNAVTATNTATTMNLGSTVAADLNSTTYPVTVGNYSLSKAYKLQFNGTFANISAIKFYISTGSYVTGEQINYGTSTTFHVPTGGGYADSVALTVVPTSLPSTQNIAIGDSLTGSITTSGGTTDYIFLQSSISILASATTIPVKTLVFTYTES